MAENVSSSVLFHFTKSMASVRSILKNGFSPHYCPEYSPNAYDREAVSKRRPPMRAAPMVCFCDLPLSLIRRHLREYGPYGIGLDKKWGLRNGVAPVIYTHPAAHTRLSIQRLTDKVAESNDRTAANDAEILAAYTKPFVGPAWRNNRVRPGVRFYEEREWRYVPVVHRGDPLFLDRDDYHNKVKVNRIHKRFREQNALQVPQGDIQYLILPYTKDERETVQLHAFLRRLYGIEDAIKVTTAIMTVDRIEKDV
jgi:hypothetical protein